MSAQTEKLVIQRRVVQTGKTNAVKKAIVQLAEGDAIDFYE